MQWLHQNHPYDNDLSLVDYFPDVLIATPMATGSELLIEELEPANNETLPSERPQGDAETSIVLPGEESVETTQKSIRCDGGSTDIDNNGVERRGEL